MFTNNGNFHPPLMRVTEQSETPQDGPCMEALRSDLQRQFVRVAVQNPRLNGFELCRLAGYKGKKDGMRVTAHNLLTNDKVLAAIAEETQKRVRYAGLLGITGLIRIATDDTHKHQYRACADLADRGGFAAVARQEIKVEHTDRTGAALVDRIRKLAEQLGLDTSKMLGDSAADVRLRKEPKLIEGKVEDGNKSGSD